MNLNAKQLRSLWIVMFALQEAWLAATWLAGASANPRKLIFAGVYSLACLLLILLLSEKTVETLQSVYEWMERRHTDFFVVLGLTMICMALIYTSGQRVWTDEAENFRLSGRLASEGFGYLWKNYTAYGWARQHPPLIFLINGAVMLLYGIDLQVIRWVSAFASLGVVAATYYLGRTLFNRAVGMLAVVYLATFPLFVRVGTAGMLDAQVTFFFTTAVLVMVAILRRPSFWAGMAWGGVLGVTLGLGMLTKYSMMMAIPLIIVLAGAGLWRLDKDSPERWKQARRILAPLAVTGVIAGAMFVSWARYADQIGVYTPLSGTFQLFRPAPETAEVPPVDEAEDAEDYMSFSVGFFLFSVEGLKFTINSMLTRLPPGIGLYLFPLIGLGGWLGYRRRSEADWLLFTWIAVTAGLLLLTIPDHRYFLPIFPALAILIARWMDTNPAAITRTTILAFLFQFAALYVFIDWNRLNLLF